MSIKIACGLGGVFALLFSTTGVTQEDDYVHIRDDLTTGMDLQEVADRAYQQSEDYWEFTHGHDRDGHEHDEHGLGDHDGTDEELSAGEAVAEIYAHAGSIMSNVDSNALDIVKIATAVVDAWPDCEDTFDAVRSAVELMPNRADEIVANIAVKRDCNCSNGGIWIDQRVQDRLRVQMRHQILDVPIQCSCSQVAMYAGIAGLRENREFTAALRENRELNAVLPENRELNAVLLEKKKAELIDLMTEKVTVITDRTAALQSKNDWECGCTNINIAASMQGIEEDELREGIYDGLAKKYADEAADTGLVVDSFGIVGMHPAEYWGDGINTSRSNTLRRKTKIYRGDNLILDPFHPESEFKSHGEKAFDQIGQHKHTSDNTPTDLIISEYIEGWNEEALASPDHERTQDQRNRVIELYNGSDKTIDLGNDQYFLEIYAGPDTATTTVETPPLLQRKTISLESDVTFEFDRAEIRPAADPDLRKVVKVLNEADLFSEILIVGHTCDLGSDEYNLVLSERRADSVKDFLVNAGLEVPSIRTEGHGELEPRLANSSIANRSRNRRVDITYVVREGEDIETKVSEADDGGPKHYEYTFLLPELGNVVSDVDSQAVTNNMPSGEYNEGDMDPRQVIGLNGAVEPGETFVVAYNESDEILTDAAQLVTKQLDFNANETLVVRRLGGEMALSCRAQSYAYVLNYPAIPIILQPDPFPPPPPGDIDVASPN